MNTATFFYARATRIALCIGLLFFILPGNISGAVEKTVSSRAGIAPLSPIVANGSITIADQWYYFMQSNPLTSGTPWTNTFVVPNASNGSYDAWTNVILRFDDSKQHYYAYDWDFTVTYNITTFSFNPSTGAVVNSGNLSSSLTITHTNAGTYQDKAVERYPNAFRASLVITSCTLTVHTSPSPTITYGSLPGGYEDIYMDLEQETQRIYRLSSAPTTGLFNVNTHNELEVAWGFVQGAESYDLEWLFIDEPLSSLTTANLSYDFKNATRVNIPEQHYNIPLAFPRGILLYRVRGVGKNPANPDLWLEGTWSFPYEAGTTNDINTAYSGTSYHFRHQYNGLEPGMNWQYSSTFAEDGKRKEGIVFFDGSFRARQSETMMNTDQNLVIGETKYDYDGAPVVSILPVPLSGHTGLGYYPNFNPSFDRTQFATDATINTPGTMSTSSGAGLYYSTSNTTATGLVQYVPDAQGYPYTQVRYTTDGTGRLRAQSSPGGDHHLGSDHETKFYYGSPTDQAEIDRLFGNEVGNLNHYQKIMVVDANKQVAISYLDQEGRVIAASLAGDVPDNLLPVDGRPDDVVRTANLLLGRNAVDADNTAMVSSTTLVCTAPGTEYDFSYALIPDTSCSECFICKSCMYDLRISVLDQDGIAVGPGPSLPFFSITSQSCTPSVTGNPIICRGISSGTYDFTATLDIGTYTVIKTLSLSEASLDIYEEEFKQYQLENFGCVKPKPIHPESCGYDCASMCYKRYTIIDENGDVIYVNDAGEKFTNQGTTSMDPGPMLIAACETANCGSSVTALDECSVKRSIMRADMSRGGQYFENLPEKYVYDGNDNLINNTNYVWDAWLTTNVPNSSGFWTAFNNHIASSACGSLSITVSNWNNVRSLWQDCFADFLINFHPEFCTYNYYCDERYCKNEFPALIDMSLSNDLDHDMYLTTSNTTANTNGYFNPSAFPSTTTSSAGAGTDNSAYIGSYTAGSDPFFSCDNIICSTITEAARINTFLSEFLPIGSGNYYSIWYVIDDPDDIHTLGTATGAPASVVSYFQALHGTSGLIGTGPGQLSKYEYFRSVYQFYKKLIQYAQYPSQAVPACTDARLTDANQDGFTDDAIPGPMPGFQIRYPAEVVFDAYIAGSPNFLCDGDFSALATAFTDMNESVITTQCQANCEANADSWIEQLASCSLTSLQIANIRPYLVQVCELNCDAENTEGTTGCADCPTNPCAPAVSCAGVPCVGCTPSATFYDFEDVITYFTGSTCTTTVVYPSPGSGQCSCNTLTQYLFAHGLSTETDANIAIYINNDFYGGAGTVSASDVNDWKTITCLSSFPTNTALIADNFPSQLLCMEPGDMPTGYDEGICTCENIHSIINQMGLDPDDAGDADAITAGLNAYLAPTTPITSLEWPLWLLECQNSSPSLATLTTANLPSILACPIPASISQDDLDEAMEKAACMQSNLGAAMANAVIQFHQALEDENNPASSQQYIAYMRQNCLSNLAGRETFTVTYSSNEFLYTLYYYDQAGNLIKTVPPAGVVLLTDPEVLDVQDYRAGVALSAFTSPVHTLVTNYKYNSMQQPISQATPDGGITHFFYDKLGRIVVSQNAKQAVYTSPPSYSYTRYDNLGRPLESGELKQSIAMTNQIARDKDPVTGLITWLTVPDADKTQVVKTFFDAPMSGSVPGFTTNPQQNLRGRVSSIIHFNGSLSGGYTNYDNAYHYSYDIHGNVNILSQENKSLQEIYQSIKLITYEYDLVSGNVNAVHYQDGYPDQFHHQYNYDADNRLVGAYSSHDRVIWEKEAKYFYYPTGLSGRKEIGDREVQGTDYAFTIQGWLKGVNSDSRVETRDIGRDGSFATSRAQNSQFGRDVYGFSLSYFDNDYVPIIASAGNFLASPTTVSGNPYHTGFYGLYNGNIAAMTTSLTNQNEAQVAVQGRNFRYDQLNRIKQANAFSDADLVADNLWSNSASDNGNYYEDFAYDFNGNITNARRNGHLGGTSQQMDFLTYNYTSNTNQLSAVIDGASCLSSDYGNDFDASNTYTYDAIGNLETDASEQIDQIHWTPQGKIWKVTRVLGSTKSDLEFVYDAMGHRIEKIVKPRTVQGLSTENSWTYMYYARDAQGSVLAVYDRTFTHGTGNNYTDNYNLKEKHIYGSSRIGIYNDPATAITNPFTATINSSGYFVSTYSATPPTQLDLSIIQLYQRELGNKAYELSNHLGNVLQTISDRTLAAPQTNVYPYNDFSTSLSPWTPDVASVTLSSGRMKIVATSAGSGAVMNALSVTPGMHYTLSFSIDLGIYGVDAYVYDDVSSTLIGSRINMLADGTYQLDFSAIGTAVNIVISSHDTPLSPNTNTFYIDNVSVGNVGLVEYYVADVLSYSDYYAFGAPMPGRSFVSASKYRYDFNGKENDGETSTQDYGMRIYNPSLGRFLSVDPITAQYPMLTPYQFASNRPIDAIDLDGLEALPMNDMHAISGPWSLEMIEEYSSIIEYNPEYPFTISEFASFYISRGEVAELTNPSWENAEFREDVTPRHMLNGEEVANKMAIALSTSVTMYYDPNSGVPYVEDAVGDAGFGESFIPVWGSGRNSINDFQHGRYLGGTFNAALAISDVFLIRSIGKGLLQGGLKLTGTHAWRGANGTRAYYLKSGFAKPGQPLHHWLIHQNGPIGKYVPNAIKNQMWNLKPMPSASFHMRAGHGKNYLGQPGYGLLGRLHYGTPTWAKASVTSGIGRVLGPSPSEQSPREFLNSGLNR